MTTLIIAVFLASLTGSLHCAGMCGAFVAFAVGGMDGVAKRRFAPLGAYHAGRLLTYTALGVGAGALGAAIDLGGSAVGLSRAAAIVAGAMMIGFGVIVFLRTRGVALPRAPLPPGVRRIVSRVHRFAAGRTPVMRALLIGLATTLLPCGWLYAFVITAAGTADPATGGVTMAVFWAGTLPILTAVGVGAQTLLGPLQKRVPMLTALALIAVGLFTVGQRLMIPAFDGATGPNARMVADSPEQEIERVRALPKTEAPCCHDNN